MLPSRLFGRFIIYSTILKQRSMSNVLMRQFRFEFHHLAPFGSLEQIIHHQPMTMSIRSLAKGKDRVREKNRSDRPKVMLNDDEMEQVMQYEELRSQVDLMIDEFKNDLKLNFNVKLNPRVIERFVIIICCVFLCLPF